MAILAMQKSECNLLDLNRMVSIGYLIDFANELKSADTENPEYDRALMELIAFASGLPVDEGRDIVAHAMGERIGERIIEAH